jgi:hypothetical protein
MGERRKNYPGLGDQQADCYGSESVALTASEVTCSLDHRRWISGHLLPPGPFGPNQRAKAPDVALRACRPGGFSLPRNRDEVVDMRRSAEMCCRICMCLPLEGWTGESARARQEAES